MRRVPAKARGRRESDNRKPDGVFSRSEPQDLRAVDLVTPSGIEGGPNIAERRRRTALPTEPPAVVRPEATSGCNECNEALDMARDVLAKARRLALVVQNALLNADLQRAFSVLRDLQVATSRSVVTAELEHAPDSGSGEQRFGSSLALQNEHGGRR
jgi:hypothetical protein